MSYMYTMYLDHVCLLPPPGNSTWPPRNTTSPQFQVPSLFFNNPLNPMSSAYVWASSLPVVTYNPKTWLPQNLLTTRILQVGMGQQEPFPAPCRVNWLDLVQIIFSADWHQPTFPVFPLPASSQWSHSSSTFGLQFAVLSFPHFPDHGSSGQFLPFSGLRSTLVILEDTALFPHSNVRLY